MGVIMNRYKPQKHGEQWFVADFLTPGRKKHVPLGYGMPFFSELKCMELCMHLNKRKWNQKIKKGDGKCVT